ncbi:hypothetical protein BGX23_008353 [Mortierella sp. AD031]|nr:hypothetical protein BGX23_008353 [Mortierella sp. AD031]
MKYTIIIAAAFAVFAATQTEALDWKLCEIFPNSGSPLGPTDFTDVTFKMDGEWACVGQKICGTLTGNLQTPIVDPAQFVIQVKYLGRVTHSYQRDFCKLMANNGYSCPIAAGPKTITACIDDWPGTVVDIPTSVTMHAVNGNNHVGFCVEAKGAMNKNCTTTP